MTTKQAATKVADKATPADAKTERRELALPEPVARRGISASQWLTLKNSLYPGAASESVLMVWDYCAARKLDPLKKPCHIVPMEVKDAKTGRYEWRDVVLPGIYEYRTTAARTGLYLGHSAPVYGPDEDAAGVVAPAWCEMTFYRWSKEAGQRIEFPVRVYFRELVATNKEGRANKRWSKAPVQMLTKCCEAAGLREAFPDELGGQSTVEELEGRTIEGELAPAAPEVETPRATPGARIFSEVPAEEIRSKLHAAGVSESAFCVHFQIDCIESLPLSAVDAAFAYIGSVHARAD